MEQPENKITILHEEDYDDHHYYVDIETDTHNGFCNVGVVSHARSEGAALRMAAKRFRKLANECEKMAK